MYNNDRFGSSGGGKFAKKGNWNRAGAAPRGPRPPKELFDAVCSDCRKECKVPFFPSEGRPVQCLDCFRASAPEGGDRERKPSFDRFNRSDRGERPAYRSTPRFPSERSSGGDVEKRLAAIERKLDNILELLDADEV